MTFLEQLQTAEERNQSMLCVGLDPEPAKFPVQTTNCLLCRAPRRGAVRKTHATHARRSTTRAGDFGRQAR